MIREDIILSEITRITQEKGFRLSSHARDRMNIRYMDRDRVLQILLDPRRLIRIDLTDKGPKYTIKGGPRNRKLSVVLDAGRILVVTVM